MSWNRSEASPAKKQAVASSNQAVRLFIISLCIVAVAAVSLWLFHTSSPSTLKNEPQQEKAKIVEVKPSLPKKVDTPVAEDEGEKIDPSRYYIEQGKKPIPTYGLKVHKDENGILRYETGQRVYNPNEPAEKLQLVKGDPPIFKRRSENAIAALLTLVPGEMIAERTYGDEFVKDFNESLSEPIEFSEDDSEYVRNVKTLVKQAKEELYQAMNNGQDIAEIMNETRTDLRNLALVRKDISTEVRNIDSDENASVEDVEDAIKAANILLAEKGIKQISAKSFARYNLMLENKQKDPSQTENNNE